MYFKLHHSDENNHSAFTTITRTHYRLLATGTKHFVELKTCWAAEVVVVEADRTSQEPRVVVRRAVDPVAVVVRHLVVAV